MEWPFLPSFLSRLESPGLILSLLPFSHQCELRLLVSVFKVCKRLLLLKTLSRNHQESLIRRMTQIMRGL